MLQLLFKDLARRSTKETINKDSFSLIFNLPVNYNQGLLGERLFNIFDTKKAKALDMESFINGIANYSKSNTEKKVKIIFEICDSKEDHKLDAKELYVVVIYKQLTLLGTDILRKVDNGLLNVQTIRGINLLRETQE